MPRRPATPPPTPPDWSPEKTHAALKKQLIALDHQLGGKDYRQAETDEREWSNLTHVILEHGFGENSSNVQQFSRAKIVGQVWSPQMSSSQQQHNFKRRIEALASVVRSSIAELELIFPEPEIAGAYDVGEDYAFYRDVKTIVGFATKELFIIDNYLDTQLFDVYAESVAPQVVIRVLTNQVTSPLRLVAEKFAKRGNFELRSSKDVHDRNIFADDRCWVIGQSIKDAAVKKPTYIVEHSGASTMRSIYEPLWASATCVVKS
jgi:hypothetical protein